MKEREAGRGRGGEGERRRGGEEERGGSDGGEMRKREE